MSREFGDFSWVISDEMMVKEFNPKAYDFEGAVQRGIDSATKQLAERAEIKMREQLHLYGLGSSGIMDEIVFEVVDGGISIHFKGHKGGGGETHSYMFVEFGTGVIGKQGLNHPFMSSPHNIKWEYDSNNHGEAGWWYPTVPVDPNPTLRWFSGSNGSKDGWYAWTKGTRSRPFMYDTWKYLSNATIPTYRAHINRELAKMEGMQ